ncbi:WhiB family transcriptional regulator [Streptomyces sp. PSKA01]|uniref:Transcriptional regulator WhiB n=1 Tax=Streptomyces cupreus TaxID=2759956 RepID=A0A7X1J7N6_9ACTN|nr:WhiB family transcriptional regulator [Streptomyces cupreus]
MTRTGIRDTRTNARPADWRDTASCRKEDPELFFPKGTDGPWLLAIQEAKKVCRRCPSVDACLAFANDNNISDGIYGGLTEHERRSLRRSVARGNTAPEEAAAKAEAARQSEPAQPRTIGEYFNLNTRAQNGHRVWVGTTDAYWGGRKYTPKQLAFTQDRGHYPSGRVYSGCGVSGCVLPAHLTDQEERGTCGTRSGYTWHRRRGEEACEPCKRANTDADNRLRRTGTTLELAS